MIYQDMSGSAEYPWQSTADRVVPVLGIGPDKHLTASSLNWATSP